MAYKYEDVACPACGNQLAFRKKNEETGETTCECTLCGYFSGTCTNCRTYQELDPDTNYTLCLECAERVPSQ